jgi:Flp pilus assembly protein TadD
MKKGFSEEAVSAYEKAIELLPGHARAYGNLAYVYLQNDQVTEALAQCRRALDIYPDLPEVLATLGAVLIRRGQFDEAGGGITARFVAVAEARRPLHQPRQRPPPPGRRGSGC